jgi:hypothetical protein
MTTPSEADSGLVGTGDGDSPDGFDVVFGSLIERTFS